MKLDNDTKRKLYRSLCQEADELLKKYEPCYIVDGKCLRSFMSNKNEGMCCDKCRYLSKTGCSVRSLVCKLWLCDDAIKFVDRTFIEKAKDIFKRADNYELIMFRACEDDVIYGFGGKTQAEVQMPWGTIYFIDSAQDVS